MGDVDETDLESMVQVMLCNEENIVTRDNFVRWAQAFGPWGMEKIDRDFIIENNVSPKFHGHLEKTTASRLVALKNGDFLYRYSSNPGCITLTRSTDKGGKVAVMQVHQRLTNNFEGGWISEDKKTYATLDDFEKANASKLKRPIHRSADKEMASLYAAHF